MNITLTPKLEAAIAKVIKNGEYTTVSEVIRDAVRHWLRKHEEDRTIPAPANGTKHPS